MISPRPECDPINGVDPVRSCHLPLSSRALAEQFLRGEKHDDASDDREKFSPQYRRGLLDQLTDLGDGVAEESGIGLRSDGQFPANVANASSFKREASPALSMSCHERE